MDSKAVMLQKIIAELEPSIINLNELNYKGNRKVKVAGYKCLNKNRVQSKGGGVATCIVNADSKFVLKVKEGKENEMLVMRHCQFIPPINIINIYGEQECRTTKNQIEEKWNEVLETLATIKNRDEMALVIGDLNKLVGNAIPENHEKVSSGGELVRELISSDDYVLGNTSDKVVNGPFTRYEPNDVDNMSKRSCLDLVIASSNLMKYVKELKIDKDFSFTPGYSTGTGMKYTDHFGMLLTFEGIPMKDEVGGLEKKEPIWNVNKPGGWEKYFNLTNENRILDNAVANSLDSNRLNTILSKETNKIKYIAFGKVKPNGKLKVPVDIQRLEKEKERLMLDVNIAEEEKEKKASEIDLDIIHVLKAKQNENLEREMDGLKQLKEKKGRAAATFKLKNDVVGAKKSQQEPTTILDPESGEVLYNPKEIRETVLKYCKNLLTNSEPNKGFEDDIAIKNLLHQERMREDSKEVDDIMTLGMFNKSLEEVWRDKKEKYQFIARGGHSLKNAIFHLFQTVWRHEEIPEGWNKTTLLQIFKGKGDFRDLSMMRNIHLKEEIQKLFSHVLVSQIKGTIMNNMTPFQIGARKGHRPQEHIFLVKSMMQLFQIKKKPLTIQLYDVSKFFNKENLPDVMNEIYRCGIKGKKYRLLY